MNWRGRPSRECCLGCCDRLVKLRAIRSRYFRYNFFGCRINNGKLGAFGDEIAVNQ
jgi:hypothetical protein